MKVGTFNMTPKRLEVLQAVADGEVTHYRSWGAQPDEDDWKKPGEPYKRVSGVVEALRTAGLVKLPTPVGMSAYAGRKWQLTPKGERVLRGEKPFEMPQPECRLGYTSGQVRQIVGGDFGMQKFSHWMTGQTVGLCLGEPPCLEAHGTAFYRNDILTYLEGRPVLD